MTPEQFVAKWKASTLRESQASQEQFIEMELRTVESVAPSLAKIITV